jgi:cell pole-organizing protein PopZ
LLATETTAAAVGTLSGLVAAVDRAHGGSVLGDGNRTIEDLVKEVMRPMVKAWLDENLPSLTERLVRREIERLARHAEDD